MNNDIEWKMVKLADVCSMPTKTICSTSFSPKNYIGTENMLQNCSGIIDNEIPLSYGRVREYKEGDILMSNIRPYLKKIWFSDKNAGCSTDVNIFRANDKCLPQYLFHVLCQDNFFKFVNDNAVGTKMPRGDKKVIPNYKIPIPYKNGSPDLETQALIAQKLGDMDNLIAAKEKLLAKKRNLKIAAMQKLIKDEESENWRKVKLGDLINSANYGVGAEAIDFDGENKYLRITDIDDTTRKFIPNPLVSPSFYSSRYIVQKDDLLIARTGASVGKTYLYDEEDGKLIYAGFLMKLHISNAVSKFVFYQTLTDEYNQFILSESARTGQPGINLQQIKKFEVNIPYNFDGTPNLTEQKRIASILSDMDSEISSVEKELTKLQNLKTAMMQKMFCFKEVTE